MGVHAYQLLENLPAVESNLFGLRDVFTDQGLWGLDDGHCVVLSQPDSARTVLDTLREVAVQATDTLVIYYAGHGLTDPYTDELCLSLPDSDPEHPYTAVRYEYLRRLVLDPRVRARRKVVILDCCYSGRALIGGMSATTQVADQAVVDGTYILTASAETRKAVAPPGETYTAFTGELISTLAGGVPDGPELLDMETVYRHLYERLAARSRPIPQQRNRNAGGLIALARNMASRAAAPSPGHRLRGVYAGVALIVSEIARTLGPAGGLVRFTIPDGKLATTADPAMICETTTVPDPESELGAELIRTLVRRMRAQWADGAATAAVIAQAMMASALGSVERGADPARLGLELLRLGGTVVDELNRRAVDVETRDQIAHVLATATGDRDGAEMLADAANKVGTDGVIAVEKRGVPGLELEHHTGMFLPSRERSGADVFPELTVEDPLVVVLSEPPTEAMRQRARQQSREGTQVIILSPGRQPDTIVADTTVEEGLTVVLPTVDPLAILDDIAVLTGAELSDSWNPVTILEAAIGPAGVYLESSYTCDMDKLNARILELCAKRDAASTVARRERFGMRVARLAGASATVWTGQMPGEPEAEFAARKDVLTRGKDLIHPLVERGYLDGGGAALHAAGAVLDAEPDGPAKQALRDGLLAPLTHVAAGCGHAPDQALTEIAAARGATGLEVITGRAMNMAEAEVLDVAAVVTGALAAAVDTTRKFLALA